MLKIHLAHKTDHFQGHLIIFMVIFRLLFHWDIMFWHLAKTTLPFLGSLPDPNGWALPLFVFDIPSPSTAIVRMCDFAGQCLWHTRSASKVEACMPIKRSDSRAMRNVMNATGGSIIPAYTSGIYLSIDRTQIPGIKSNTTLITPETCLPIHPMQQFPGTKHYKLTSRLHICFLLDRTWTIQTYFSQSVTDYEVTAN